MGDRYEESTCKEKKEALGMGSTQVVDGNGFGLLLLGWPSAIRQKIPPTHARVKQAWGSLVSGAREMDSEGIADELLGFGHGARGG